MPFFGPGSSYAPSAKIEAINSAYFENLSQKAREKKAVEITSLILSLIDNSISVDNFYLTIGATKNKTALVLTMTWGNNVDEQGKVVKVPVYAGNAVDLFEAVASSLENSSRADARNKASDVDFWDNKD